MSKDPFSKLQSSLSLEDLLAQPNTRNSQNWLLTYLDVFVLIVMLVITLISLSDINTEQAATSKLQATKVKKTPACPPVVAPILTTCPPSVAADTQPVQPIALSGNKADELSTKTNSKDSSIAPVITTMPDIKNLPDTEENPQSTPADAEQVDSVSSADENKLQQQLAKTIDEFGLNKAINIKIAQGYAQLEIQDNVLFKSSEADLTASGGALLKRLTPLLKQTVGLILIEGHTDNVPIKTPRFPSNWELGSSRATSVLHFLVLQQLDSSRLRAITYADTMPIADNSTPEGREKNRRVNILIKFSEQ